MDLIEFGYDFSIGIPGKDSDERNPFHRSVRRLFTSGKPFSRLAFSFLRDKDQPPRWLGVFVQGKRTMFFPGFAQSLDRAESAHGSGSPTQQEFAFDHVTLESHRKEWHVSEAGTDEHIGGPKTLDLGDGRVLWFGLSFASMAVFRPAMKRTSIEFSSPKNDSKRRIGVLRSAREGAEFPIIEFNEAQAIPIEQYFFHLAVVAGPPGFDIYRGPVMGLPNGNPHVIFPAPSNLLGLPIRTHRLMLSSETELQITASRVPGILGIPQIFTGSSAPASGER